MNKDNTRTASTTQEREINLITMLKTQHNKYKILEQTSINEHISMYKAVFNCCKESRCPLDLREHLEYGRRELGRTGLRQWWLGWISSKSWSDLLCWWVHRWRSQNDRDHVVLPLRKMQPNRFLCDRQNASDGETTRIDLWLDGQHSLIDAARTQEMARNAVCRVEVAYNWSEPL